MTEPEGSWPLTELLAMLTLGFALGAIWATWRERRAWQRRERTRIGIVRSLGRDVAPQPDAVGTAEIRPATFRRTRWEDLA